MEWVVLIVVVLGVVVLVTQNRARNRRREQVADRDAAELASVRRMTEEDVTRFGEELQRLDDDMLTENLDEATRQDYQRALSSYEAAGSSLAQVRDPDDIRHVTTALEDGRYAVTCVRARVAGEALPTRRPPCFFNPAHGPSTTDIEWAPPGGKPRQIPVCAADQDRVAQGAEPDVRTVQQGAQRVPYWQAGRAYAPWASGYYGGYATSGLLPGFLLGSMLAPGWGGGFMGDPFGADGSDDPGGFDGGGDGSGGGDFGDGGGGDFGGGDFGGDFGDFGGGGFDL
ncbi:MAG TPA: hypothetical protein VFJ19_20465 [Nocardioidaceae bacterium]|nr:hypothetical protein [Nocardioidaceae bacterium]